MTRPEFAVYRPPQRPTAGTYLRRLPRAVPLRKSRRTSQPTIETAFACNGYNLTAAKAPRNNASATFLTCRATSPPSGAPAVDIGDQRLVIRDLSLEQRQRFLPRRQDAGLEPDTPQEILDHSVHAAVVVLTRPSARKLTDDDTRRQALPRSCWRGHSTGCRFHRRCTGRRRPPFVLGVLAKHNRT